jgi:hypothetical protein
MEIAAALLCDAATVREGLLHVLGGAITRVWSPALPAPLRVALAAVIELAQEETALPHELQVEVFDPDGTLIGMVMGGFQTAPNERLEPGEHVLVPVALDLRMVGTNRFGCHVLRLRLDAGIVEREMRMWLLHTDERDLPGVR